MTVKELKTTIEIAEQAGRDALIFVVGPRKRPSERVRLLVGDGPLGELLSVNANGDCVARFKVKALRKWLRKAGAKA